MRECVYVRGKEAERECVREREREEERDLIKDERVHSHTGATEPGVDVRVEALLLQWRHYSFSYQYQ